MMQEITSDHKFTMPHMDILNEFLEYNPADGVLIWKPRDLKWFQGGKHSDKTRALRWNNRNAGNIAFTTIDSKGYNMGAVFNRLYRAHRVIWKLIYGNEPGVIDHINGIRTDNRICNLRKSDLTANARNSAMRNTNKSGVTGVRFDPYRSKWIASIGHRTIGRFDDIGSAIAARVSAEKSLGYDSSHGRRRYV